MMSGSPVTHVRGKVMDDGSIEGINHLGFGESILIEVGMNLEQERWRTNGERSPTSSQSQSQ